MARGTKQSEQELQRDLFQDCAESADGEGDDKEVVLEGTLVCILTDEHRTSTPQEEVHHSSIKQLHRKYVVSLEDMDRDVRLISESSEDGKVRTRNCEASLVAFEHGAVDRNAGNALAVETITQVVNVGSCRLLWELAEQIILQIAISLWQQRCHI